MAQKSTASYSSYPSKPREHTTSSVANKGKKDTKDSRGAHETQKSSFLSVPYAYRSPPLPQRMGPATLQPATPSFDSAPPSRYSFGHERSAGYSSFGQGLMEPSSQHPSDTQKYGYPSMSSGYPPRPPPSLPPLPPTPPPSYAAQAYPSNLVQSSYDISSYAKLSYPFSSYEYRLRIRPPTISRVRSDLKYYILMSENNLVKMYVQFRMTLVDEQACQYYTETMNAVMAGKLAYATAECFWRHEKEIYAFLVRVTHNFESRHYSYRRLYICSYVCCLFDAIEQPAWYPSSTDAKFRVSEILGLPETVGFTTPLFDANTPEWDFGLGPECVYYEEDPLACRSFHTRRRQLWLLSMQHENIISVPEAQSYELEAMEYRSEDWDGNKIGQGSLGKWKCSAGKAKSWRRYPKTIAARPRKRKTVKPRRDEIAKLFARSPLWLPATFIQDSRQRHGIQKQRAPRLVAFAPSARKPSCDNFKAWQQEMHQFSRLIPVRSQTSATTLQSPTDEEIEREPGLGFMRLASVSGSAPRIQGHMDRFLPDGLLICPGIRVAKFIRNDNHADVYSAYMDQAPTQISQGHNVLEVHLFLDEYHGNSETFAKRHRNRQYNSGNCLATFRLSDRHCLVMHIPEPSRTFKLRNSATEYPYLNPCKKSSQKTLQKSSQLPGRLSYAAVVKSGFAVEPALKEVVMKDRVLAQVKRAEKQRSKRQEQRRQKAVSKMQVEPGRTVICV